MSELRDIETEVLLRLNFEGLSEIDNSHMCCVLLKRYEKAVRKDENETYSYAAELEARIKELEEENARYTWQSIETAPKDGTIESQIEFIKCIDAIITEAKREALEQALGIVKKNLAVEGIHPLARLARTNDIIEIEALLPSEEKPECQGTVSE